jgi:hypothetical protein
MSNNEQDRDSSEEEEEVEAEEEEGEKEVTEDLSNRCEELRVTCATVPCTVLQCHNCAMHVHY